jgi:hypothetical protein
LSAQEYSRLVTTRRPKAATFAAMLLALAFARGPGCPAAAQPPVAETVPESWRTLETDHFRIHFKSPAEEFARAVTARVEAARAEVSRLVGFFPERKVEVVIGDPEAAASARGLPFREGARILLHAAPPASARLEDFDDWIAVALGSELAHIAHLSRPPENRAVSLLTRTLPVTSLVIHLPDWLPEAYSTSIGDRLDCAGATRRPLDAALLRELAAGGRMPELADLDGDTAWPRVPLRDAVGASFLSWLEARPRGSLPEVWRRMTASAPRTFRGSVTRTFGAPLESLYAEWRRELAVRPIEDAHAASDDSAGSTPSASFALDAMSAPHAAADGAIVVTVRRHEGRPRLAIVGRDGEVRHFLDLDAADVDTEPRWLGADVAGAAGSDRSVLFVRSVSDGRGKKGSDLFRWWPGDGRVERVTSGAVLRAVDGAPDGSWAVAVENHWGRSALVRVALDREPASVETLFVEPAGTVLDSPRISPDGRELAFLRHRGAGWRLVVRDLASGAERELGDPGVRVLAWPAWAPDGRWIAVTVAAGDTVRLEAWPTGDIGEPPGKRLQVSASRDLAMAASFDAGDSAQPDGEVALVYLVLGGESPGVRLVRSAWPASEPDSWAAVALAPAAPSPGVNARSCPTFEAASDASRPYGHGPTTYSGLLGGGFSPSTHNIVGGWRGGDVIGRWEAVALTNAAADDAESGGIVSAAWRGWRLPVQFHGYSVERRPSQQPEEVPGLGESLDVIERGFALETGWKRDRERRQLDLGTAIVAHKLNPRDSETIDRYGLFLWGDADWSFERPQGSRFRLGIGFLGASGWTDSAAWQRYGGELRGGFSLALGKRVFALDGSWKAFEVEDAQLVHDRLILGGTVSSLVPPRYDLGRIYEAALPAGTLIGDRWESQRLAAGREGTPIEIFWARHRLWDEGGERGDWLGLVGVEIAADRDARPIFRLPSSAVRAGAAYVLDEPFRHRWMFWAGLSWTL